MPTITVNTTIDELDGSIFDGDISLRDALAVANDGDEIRFSSIFSVNDDPFINQTITLDPALGPLQLGDSIVIDGDSNGDGIADVTLSGGSASRIFETAPLAFVDVTLNGLYFQNGASGSGDGGAILMQYSINTLRIKDSLFAFNSAAAAGGAIHSEGELFIANSFFANNSAGGVGGAVSLENGGSIVNSTFVENEAGSSGGGIAAIGTLNLFNSTLTGNFSDLVGGGVAEATIYGFLNVYNSVIAGNRATAAGNDVAFSTRTSNGANIFSSLLSGGASGGAPGDQTIGVIGLPNLFDDVGPVTVGGTTFDAGLVSSSPTTQPFVGIVQGGYADDAGKNADVPSENTFGLDIDRDGIIESGAIEVDERGLNRIVDGTVDIGASEDFGRTWIVDVLNDIDDGILTTGNLSLREAVVNAEDGDRITFDPTVFTADGDERTNTTITLTNTVVVSGGKSITIDGDVNGDEIADVTIDGANTSGARMMYLGSDSGLALESLTVANGYGLSSGAAIFSRGTLSVLNSTLVDNVSRTYGGAIRVYDGTAYIANSTFDGNVAPRGGAIGSSGATVQIVNSTFYGNHASLSGIADSGGGAIELISGLLYLINSTVTGNSAAGSGGGINAVGGIIGIKNSIVVGNFLPNSGSGSYDVASTSTSVTNGGNVFGDSDVSGGSDITNVTVGQVFDSTANIFTAGGVAVNAGVLGSNGGATDTVLILQGGAAVDQGDSSDIPTEVALGLDVDGDGNISGTVSIDQRGGPRDAGASVDAGAVELNTDLIIVTTTEDTRDGDLSADDISWREALDLVSEGGKITFDPTLFTADDDPRSNTTIYLSDAGEGIFSKIFHMDGDVNGDGIADVTFDGLNSGDELLRLSRFAGQIRPEGQITLEGLTVRNFSDSSSGSALSNNVDLFILNSNFIDNSTTNFGGALRLYSSSNTVIANSYFGENTSASGGGAVHNRGDLVVVGSTFAGNDTGASMSTEGGGAIETIFGSAKLINSTITGNYAQGPGGAVNRRSGTLEIYNSIIAGNRSGGSSNNVDGTFTSNGANIFGAGQTGVATGDVVLSGAIGLSDIFDDTRDVTTGGAPAFEAGLPANNSGAGPTVSLKVTDDSNPALDAADPMALDENQLGIDLNFDGDTLDLVTFDGRGFARSVDLPGIGTQTTDIGAFEVQTVATRGADFLIGDTGGNMLSGLAGGDSILGDAGDDVLLGGVGGDRINGGADDDRLDGGSDNDTLLGVSGDDTINGGTGNDMITGGIGDNTLRGQGGDDDVTGASGNDEVLGGIGDDTLTGGGGDDEMLGQGNVDSLYGGAGNDTLRGGSGNDLLEGGGNDDRLFGQGNNDLMRGGSGNDTLTGATGLDTLEGGSGNDRLFGGNSSDTLEGGRGDDFINGGGQADIIVFGLGDDSDTVSGFQNNLDTLHIEEALAGTTSVATLLATKAVQDGGSVQFDFNGSDFLRITNFQVGDLLDDIEII